MDAAHVASQKQECLQVAGSRGTGKSTLVHALRAERHVRRILVMDPLGDYVDRVDAHVSKAKDVDAYLDDTFRVTDEFSVAYSPDDLPESEAAAYLAEMAFYQRNCTLIVEEAHDAARNPECPQVLIRLAKRGRHFNAGLWCISQRPIDVSPHLRSELNSNESWYLRLTEESDLEYLRARRGKRFEKLIRDLPNFVAVRLKPGVRGWEIYQVSPEPKLTLIRKDGENEE